MKPGLGSARTIHQSIPTVRTGHTRIRPPPGAPFRCNGRVVLCCAAGAGPPPVPSGVVRQLALAPFRLSRGRARGRRRPPAALRGAPHETTRGWRPLRTLAIWHAPCTASQENWGLFLSPPILTIPLRRGGQIVDQRCLLPLHAVA